MIRRAGIELIARHGFEAMDLRTLSKAAGLRGGGSLYNYFKSKEGFLFRLMSEVMEEILADFATHVAGIEDPAAKLVKFVEFHIEWQTTRREETFVSNMEIRSLSPKRRKAYIAMRRHYEDLVADIISAGCKAGLFKVADVRIAAFSMLGMLTGVSTWYHADGRLSKKKLINIYTRQVVSMLGGSRLANTG
jgi:AcrR family transcriptional regulator